MEYRYYRGPRLEFPPAITKHLHFLRYIGAMMIISFPIVGLLLLLQILELRLFWFFLIFLAGVFGPVVFIIGMAYNSIGDRGSTRGVLWQIRHKSKTKDPSQYRPDRRMIYDFYEAPQGAAKFEIEG